MVIKKWIFASVLITLTFTAMAAMPTWKIVPNESSITFTGTQNNAPVTGKFKTFSGEINFDPNQLNTSNAKIVIDMNSVTDPYNQLADILKGADWFNVKLFPQATFKSNKFIKTADKTYQAQGVLTIRDKTVPITFTFTEEDISPVKTRIKGNMILKRNDFGVGQGEWAKTDTVKNDVKVDFTLVLVKA